MWKVPRSGQVCIPGPTKDDQLIKHGGFKLCNLKEEKIINVATKVFVLILFLRSQNQWQNRLNKSVRFKVFDKGIFFKVRTEYLFIMYVY